MRVLVTGGNGQLGRSLAKTGGIGFVFADLPECDIADEVAVERLAEGVDAIVNCAAYTNVDRAEDEPEEALRVNGMGAAVVARVAARRGIPLVHISTDYIFDGTAHAPIPETAAPHPVNTYGNTKLAGEEAIVASGCKGAIIRTSWLYSEFGNNFVRTMLRLGAERRPLRVIDDQAGCPTYASDLAQAIITLLQQGFDDLQVYNYCGDGTTTWYDFAREIFRREGMEVDVMPVSSAEYGARAQRPAYSALDCSKVTSRGIKIRSWQEALADCLSKVKTEN